MEAGQTWFVISIVGEHSVALFFKMTNIFCSITGVCIGANAAVISIITQWLSDLKMGYCSDGWWLNQQFCCWEIEGEEVDGCDSWHSWSRFTLGRWMIFVIFAVDFPPTTYWYNVVLTVLSSLCRLCSHSLRLT